MREAQRCDRDRRRTQQRHSCDRRGAGGEIQLCPGARAYHGEGPPDRRGVQSLQGAAPGCRAAVPARPSRNRVTCAGHPDGRADGAEHRLGIASDPACLVAGAQAQRPAQAGCAGTYLMTETLARSMVMATAATRMKPKTICWAKTLTPMKVMPIRT